MVTLNVTLSEKCEIVNSLIMRKLDIEDLMKAIRNDDELLQMYENKLIVIEDLIKKL